MSREASRDARGTRQPPSRRISRREAAGMVRLLAHGLRFHRPPGGGHDVPVPQGGVGHLRQGAGRLDLGGVDQHRPWLAADFAADRPLEPGEGGRGHGYAVEPRHHHLRLRAELHAAPRRARPYRTRRGRLRAGGWRIAVEPLPGTASRHRARRIPCRRFGRVGGRRGARRRHQRAMGLACRLWRRRHSRPHLVAALSPRARLPDGGAGRRSRRGVADGPPPHCGRALPGPLRRRRLYRGRAAAHHRVDGLCLAAELSQPLLRTCRRQRRAQGGAGYRRGQRRRRAVEFRRRSARAARSPQQAVRTGRLRPVDRSPPQQRLRLAAARKCPVCSYHPRRLHHDGDDRRYPRGRDRCGASRTARHRWLNGGGGAESVRARPRPLHRRRALRRLRPADRAGHHPALLPALGRGAAAGLAQLRARSAARRRRRLPGLAILPQAA